MASERELIGFIEVAEMLGGVHPEHVRKRLSKRTDFPKSFRIGKRVLFDRAEVVGWIEDQRQSRNSGGNRQSE